jgi:glutamate synthase (NADPH/NADH) small chain
MACAQQLRRAGHGVVVFERDEAAGGLVRFGVPDFKIEKWVVQRRVEQLEDEGVRFRFNTDVGIDITAEELQADFDAVVLAVGARTPRDLAVAGRELTGIHFAMEYLYARNRWAASEFGPAPSAHAPAVNPVSARGKNVVVIGGGDTGADCVGQATREGAKAILQLELVPEPPLQRVDARTPWPLWPNKLRLSYAMKEVQALSRGGLDFSVVTTHLSGEDGKVQTLHVANADTQPPFAAIAGSEREHAADLVLLAMGFVHPQHEGLLTDLGVELDARGNVSAHAHASSVKGVFAAGDVRRGQSLIVWAINEGRECAQAVEHYLATSPTATS